MKSGVYQIVNNVNGKRYIGSSVNIKRRWKQHKNALIGGYHYNVYLQRSWDKYGKSNFKFQVLYLCDRREVYDNEQFFLDIFSPEYNIADIAGHPPILFGEDNPNYGKRFTEEHRRKISEANTGFRHSDETKRKLSILNSGENGYWYGKRRPAETGRKISKAKMGHSVSAETRRKISKSKTGSHHSEATKKLMSKAHMGRQVSEETRQKISESNKGKRLSEETKQKISESLTGKNLSEETKQKISEALKWQKGENHPQYIHFSDSDIEEMKEMKSNGYSYPDISSRFGVSRATIRRRILGIN